MKHHVPRAVQRLRKLTSHELWKEGLEGMQQEQHWDCGLARKLKNVLSACASLYMVCWLVQRRTRSFKLCTTTPVRWDVPEIWECPKYPLGAIRHEHFCAYCRVTVSYSPNCALISLWEMGHVLETAQGNGPWKEIYQRQGREYWANILGIDIPRTALT